jgi:hypothetical protein
VADTIMLTPQRHFSVLPLQAAGARLLVDALAPRGDARVQSMDFLDVIAHCDARGLVVEALRLDRDPVLERL